MTTEKERTTYDNEQFTSVRRAKDSVRYMADFLGRSPEQRGALEIYAGVIAESFERALNYEGQSDMVRSAERAGVWYAGLVERGVPTRMIKAAEIIGMQEVLRIREDK